jgi:hypothetical protein
MVDRVLDGEPLPVRIDPEQPSRVVIAWPTRR